MKIENSELKISKGFTPTPIKHKALLNCRQRRPVLNMVWGFTLIEVLIYVSIFAIVAGLATGILLTFTQVNQRESAGTELTSQLNFVLQRLQQLVSGSSNIEIPAGISTSTLKLRMQDISKDPTCLSLVDGVIKLAEGPGTNPNDCITNTSDLTSNRVIVNALNFKKFTQYPGHDSVSIDITMTYNTQNPQNQIQRTLSSAIARVSAATFDSNLLPGSDNSYDVGFTNPRWRNANFSGNLTVGGNVGIGTTGPLGLLHVSRSSDGNIAYFNGSSSQLKVQSNTNSIDLVGTIATNENTAQNIAIRPAGVTTAFYIKTDGKVGIGTTTPATLFSVATTTNIFNVLSSGNVGIGTSTPRQKLSVAGTIESTSGGFKFSDGTTQTTAAVAVRLSAIRVCTSTTVWSKPTGLSYIVVKIWGGGGGGGGGNGYGAAGSGGGGGGYAEKFFLAASLASTVSATVGAGGTGGYAAPGSAGGTSNFGGMATSTGGGGGYNGGTPGGTGGSGSGGDINLSGDIGHFGIGNVYGGTGGSGGDGGGAGGAGGPPAGNGTVGKAFGGGGGGGCGGPGEYEHSTGGTGGSGGIIIYEYTY